MRGLPLHPPLTGARVTMPQGARFVNPLSQDLPTLYGTP